MVTDAAKALHPAGGGCGDLRLCRSGRVRAQMPGAGCTGQLAEVVGVARERSAYFLPRQRMGWWAFWLLVATSLYPTYVGAIADVLGQGGGLAVLCAIVAGTSVGFGSVALFVTRDRSVLLALAYTATVLLVLAGAMFGLVLFIIGL